MNEIHRPEYGAETWISVIMACTGIVMLVTQPLSWMLYGGMLFVLAFLPHLCAIENKKQPPGIWYATLRSLASKLDDYPAWWIIGGMSAASCLFGTGSERQIAGFAFTACALRFLWWWAPEIRQRMATQNDYMATNEPPSTDS